MILPEYLALGYFLVGIAGSIQDIKKREVSDLVHLTICILAIIKGISFNYIAGFIVAFSIFILPNILNDDAIGGADIKFMASTGLFIGLENILIASFIGVFISLIYIFIKKLISKKVLKSIPLIPFLFTGCVITLATSFFY